MDKVEINIEALRERTADDNELALDLLQMLIENLDEYKNDILKAINEEDLNQLASELHKFKSAVAVLGFDLLHTEISDVEKKASKKSTETDYSMKINSIFISLNHHIVELEKIIKK
ncbi:MAG: hypothetical protein C0596_16380 [Marinilabiliales bacterium]|nr:MAG: hypothetical protein C0596_16380 [Marinilabiliales bacterium]